MTLPLVKPRPLPLLLHKFKPQRFSKGNPSISFSAHVYRSVYNCGSESGFENGIKVPRTCCEKRSYFNMGIDSRPVSHLNKNSQCWSSAITRTFLTFIYCIYCNPVKMYSSYFICESWNNHGKAPASLRPPCFLPVSLCQHLKKKKWNRIREGDRSKISLWTNRRTDSPSNCSYTFKNSFHHPPFHFIDKQYFIAVSIQLLHILTGTYSVKCFCDFKSKTRGVSFISNKFCYATF